jgi:hypothetical protein
MAASEYGWARVFNGSNRAAAERNTSSIMPGNAPSIMPGKAPPGTKF